ncbi:hypothetical protein C1I98_34880 [Spongiactinospora gelatinilytica]|uniref:Zf-HC2 domain-containing protein n=2 Tax=Spongiactinospora gelatinilytica TaxID=2666298 RepID=A0A2W2FTB1_9ACTN|nr:hypothetical protein C1I98_34880 [Spongiactinospora gelatinilytica]
MFRRRREPPPVGPGSDDGDLLAAVAAGQMEALCVLHRRHAPWLRARLSRRCADADVVDDGPSPAEGGTRMTGADWHVPPDLMERYAAGRLDPALVMSAEAHVGGCARCRAGVPYDEEWLAGGWDRLLDEVDRPRPRAAERLPGAVGVPEHLARLLTATPALSRAGLTAVAIVLALGATAGKFEPVGPVVLLAFLVAAPIVPVAGIALAYGRHVDPVHELQAATPMAGPRLLFIRAGAVLVTAVAMTGAATPLLPGTPGQATAWLLPALALSAATLLLSARLPTTLAAGLPGALWLGVVVPMVVAGGDRLLPFTPAAQALYGIAAVLFAFGYARHRRLSSGSTGCPRRWPCRWG